MRDITREIINMSEPSYCSFTKKLLPGVDNIYGVRLGNLRKLAKELVQDEGMECINRIRDDSFEEIMLQGMIIGRLDLDFERLSPLLASFVPKINNWSVCDSFCSGLKAAKKNPAEMWDFLQLYIVKKEEFAVRFAIVMWLNYYITEPYIEEVLDGLLELKAEGYYAKMAAAWALSICYIHFPDRTLNILRNPGLDVWTARKAVQKIRESRQVSNEAKKFFASYSVW